MGGHYHTIIIYIHEYNLGLARAEAKLLRSKQYIVRFKLGKMSKLKRELGMQ